MAKHRRQRNRQDLVSSDEICMAEANRTDEAVLVAKFDLAELRQMRLSWGLFRDRRPELYRSLTSLDGGPCC